MYYFKYDKYYIFLLRIDPIVPTSSLEVLQLIYHVHRHKIHHLLHRDHVLLLLLRHHDHILLHHLRRQSNHKPSC